MTTTTGSLLRRWPRGTVEYLEATIIADTDLEDSVAFTFDRESFHDAEWIGAVGPTRTCRVLLDDTKLSTYTTTEVFVRLTDNPEVPLIPVGTLEVY